MSNNNSNLTISLQAVLAKVKSIARLKADIKSIEPKLPKLKIQGTLDSTKTKSELNTKIKSIKQKIKIDADTAQASGELKKLGKTKTKTTVQPTVDNSQVVSGLKEAQKQTKTLWDRLAGGAVGANLIRMSVQQVTQAIYQAVQGIKELDTIKTSLQTTSVISDSDADSMMQSYNRMARDLSTTTKEVGNAANQIAGMGESLSDTDRLLESSTILAKIGMIESSQAAEYLVTSMKGFRISAEDSLQIIDKLSSVDRQAAVSAGGLAEAMSSCAGIASSSGTSMDRLIGYMATVGEVTRDSMSVIGNAFESIYSRMDNLRTGKLTDDETGESLSGTETVLNRLGIQLRDTQNTYRDFDDVLDDVANHWKDFTQTEQNEIAAAIAGNTQMERFTALMNNYSTALEYSEISADSAGSALERYGIYQDSLEAKTKELTAALESLSMNTVSEELYGGILQATTGMVEFLDTTSLLKASLTGLIALGASKALVSLTSGMTAAVRSTTQLTAAMKLFDKGTSDENLIDIGAACKGLNNNQLKLILSMKGLNTQQRLAILDGMGIAASEREQMLTTLGFSAAEDKATLSTFSLRGAWNALKTAISVNPFGLIATAVSVATMVFSSYNRAMEESMQKAKDLSDSFHDTKSEIEDYKTKIAELHQTIHNNSSFDEAVRARKDLMAVQDELIQKFGTEKETIEIITNAVNSQSDALDLLTQKQYLQWKNSFNDKSFWQDVGDFFASRNIEFAFDKLTQLDLPGTWDALTLPTQSNIDKMVESMKYAYYTIEKTGNDTLDALIAKTYDLSRNPYGSGFVLSGNLNEIYEDLLEIQEMAADFNVSQRFESSISTVANSMNNTLNAYKEAYDTYVLYEKILNSSKDNPYDEQFDFINKAKEAYDNAIASGDADKIKEASDEYAQTLQSAIDLAQANWDEDVADYFKSMYPEMQQLFGEWQFDIDFGANTDGLKDTVANALDSIDGISDGNTFFSAEDIETFNPKIATQEQIDAYADLTSTAKNYGLTLKQLITLLQNMGIIQSEVYQQLVDTFGQENLDKLSPEDLEIAYTIKNIGDMTFEELQTEIQKIKNMAIKMPLFSSFTDTDFGTRIQHITSLFNEGTLSHKEYFDALQSEINSFDASGFTDSLEEMNRASAQFFADSVQQTADGLSSLISSFDSGKMSISEYLEGYLSIGNTLSTLTDSLQENSAAWDQQGEAISATGNTALDDTQNRLRSAMSIMESYQDSVYSLEQIMNSAVTAGSDEFTAHASVIAEDLYYIVQSGGEMAETIAAALGTTTSEIAQSLTENVSSQEIACQAIAANTNNAIADMAESTGKLFDALGNAISNFKADLSFGVKSVDWKKVNVLGKELSLPEIKFELSAGGESLDQIGSAISSFGRSVTSNYTPQTIGLEDFRFGSTESAKDKNYTPGSETTKNYDAMLARIKDTSSASKETADTVEKTTDTARDCTSDYLNYMKSSLEAGRTDYRTYARDVSAFLRNMFDTGKISAKEYHDYVGQMLEEQKSILDRVSGAVTSRLDKEIDSLNDKMDEIEENYNSQMEYLDTVIEYHEKQKEILQDENEELDRQKALEEALYSLQRAQNQRTTALYTAGKGKIYVADASAVRDAEDSARKAKLDMELAKIDEAIEKVEEQQEALKEAMEAEKKQLQAVIDRLEEYKKQWSSVASEYEDIQNDMLARQVLGADYESKILDGRLDVLNSFRDEYLSIQKAITDAAWESAKAQLEASQAAQNSQDTSPSTDKQKKEVPPKQYRWYIYESGSTVPTSGPYSSRDEAVEILKINAATAKGKQFELKMEAYASGTKHAQKGLNLVGEEGTETYIDNDGNISLVTAPSLISMEGGETVINASETAKLLDNADTLPQQNTMAFAGLNSKTIPFTTDELWHRIQNAMPTFSDMVHPNIQLPTCNFASVQNTTPVVQNITLTLPNVTNNSGYERIKKELRQMQIDAYQAAHRK